MSQYPEIQQAIANQEHEIARDLIRVALKSDNDSAELWYLAALVAVNDAQKQAFLEKSVAIDPLFAPAGNALYGTPVKAVEPAPALPTIALAPLEKRALAFFTDLIIVGVASVVTFFVVSGFLPIPSTAAMTPENMTLGSMLLFAAMIAPAIYYPTMLTRTNGQTIGKRIAGIQVVRRDGKPITLWDGFLRCFVGYPMSATFLGLGFMWSVYDKNGQSWHDMTADTLVILKP